MSDKQLAFESERHNRTREERDLLKAQNTILVKALYNISDATEDEIAEEFSAQTLESLLPQSKYLAQRQDALEEIAESAISAIEFSIFGQVDKISGDVIVCVPVMAFNNLSVAVGKLSRIQEEHNAKR